MADEWIKMRRDLQRHPKVVRMASALNADNLRVIGGLHAVWSVFDEHSEDGRLDGYSLQAMDDAIHWSGFSAAMASIGWLHSVDTQVLAVPEFFEHNGQSGKRRASETKRKRQEREADKQAQDDRDPSAPDADKTADEKRTRRRKEKKKEEIPPTPPAGAFEVPAWMPEKPWADFVAMRRAKGAKVPFTVAAAKGIVAKLDEFRKAGHDVAAILTESVINGWSGVFEPKGRNQSAKPTNGASDWTAGAH